MKKVKVLIVAILSFAIVGITTNSSFANVSDDSTVIQYRIGDTGLYKNVPGSGNNISIYADNPEGSYVSIESDDIYEFHNSSAENLNIYFKAPSGQHLFFKFITNGVETILQTSHETQVYAPSQGTDEFAIYNDYDIDRENLYWSKTSLEISLSDLRPAISGNEYFASNVDKPTDVAEFVKELKAIDDIDGDISHLIKIEKDNYTANRSKIGTYDVEVSVTDSSNNKSNFTFNVVVADITAPTGSADMGIKTIGYDKTFNIMAFVNTIQVNDNYYESSEITKTVTKDTYTANKTKIGTYDLEVTLEDPSKNKSVLKFKIKVADTIPPVINGIKELTKSYTNVMSVNDIIKDIVATDAIDGNLDLVIESDNYTGNGNKPSKTPYEIVVSATDKSNNKSTHTIKVTVIDDKGADWFITNGVTLNIPKDTPMTRTQIIDLLAKAGQVVVSANSHITYSQDTYTPNIGQPGIYTMAFNVKEPNGNSNDYTFAVNVMGESAEDVDVVPADKNFFKDNLVAIIIGTTILVGTLAFVIKKRK